MAKENLRIGWQICPTCDRREYAPEAVTCRCGERMVPAVEHPDNAANRAAASPKPAPKTSTN